MYKSSAKEVLFESGGSTPLYKPYRYVPPQREGFLAPFWSENGYRFCPSWSGIGCGLRRNYGYVPMCSSFQFQIHKKESVIWEFEMDFKNSFCCGFNLNNDDIISLLCCCVLWPPHVWKRIWKMTIFWSEIGSGFGEPGRTLPPRIPRSTHRAFE